MEVALAVVAVAVWGFVAFRAWRLRVDLTLFALVLVLLAIVASQLGSIMRLPAPGPVSFAAAGLILLLAGAWPDGRRVR